MNSLNDLQYMNIIDEYVNNEKFQKTKFIEQHGVTRFEHSIKVSYYSYKIAKFLHLNYKETAVGGLLHDFFISSNEMGTKEKVNMFFSHPKLALKTASKEFELTNLEKDVIRNHMFPTTFAIPKYLESWIVCMVDKGVATGEFAFKFKDQLRYSYNLFVFFIIGFLK